jgi:hypothetical protein
MRGSFAALKDDGEKQTTARAALVAALGVGVGLRVRETLIQSFIAEASTPLRG